jgi:hypothetical protein
LSKDRAAPFSKKHRRYWIPVLGGMIGIGIFNLAIGYCIYKPPESPERIQLHIPPPGTPADTTPHTLADGTVEQAISNGEIPGAVMRAYSTQFPRTIPTSAVRRTKAGAVSYKVDSATYREDGSPP